MKHWFKALYDAVRSWYYNRGGLPERIARTVERPQVPLPIERPPVPRRVIAIAGHPAQARRPNARSAGQRNASKRRAFVQSLRRDA